MGRGIFPLNAGAVYDRNLGASGRLYALSAIMKEGLLRRTTCIPFSVGALENDARGNRPRLNTDNKKRRRPKAAMKMLQLEMSYVRGQPPRT